MSYLRRPAERRTDQTEIQAEELSALVSTAASTCCTCNPSSKDGVGCRPSARAVTRSTTWWVKPCS